MQILCGFLFLGVNRENFKDKFVIIENNFRFKFKSQKLKRYEKFKETKQNRTKISVRRTTKTILRLL
jgi:hypothetical protein